MIPNITTGSDTTGLTTYLVGEGRANEHENPHLVAGSAPIMAWFDNQELTHQDALEIGQELEQPHRVFGTDMPRGHVWHCSLSVHPDDGVLSDDEWSTLSQEFVAQMGFTNVEGKADARWVAVRHGLSGQNGNDHVHLVVSLVREDGTKVDTWMDYPRSQEVARGLERKHGLLEIVPGRGAVGLAQGVVRGSQARGLREPEPKTLGRKVRGYAEASRTEAEFVRRCREGGLIIEPSYVKGSTDEVRGYVVALKPPEGMKPLRIGGSKLGRDLGLGVLRRNWETSPELQMEASTEWHAAKYGKRVVGPSPTAPEPDAQEWKEATEELEQWQEQMQSVPLDDHEQWRSMASHVSGVWASWSTAVEPAPGGLAAVADEVAKSAQVSRTHYRPPVHHRPMRLRAATVLTFAAASGGPSAQWAMFSALTNLTREIYNYNEKRRDLVRRRSFREMMQADLARVASGMRAAALDHEGIAVAVGAPSYGVRRGPEQGSVMPNRLDNSGAHQRPRGQEHGTDLSR